MSADWRRLGAVDWICADPPGADALGADSATAEIGFVLGRGYAHESPAELGVTEAAASALARALGRPVETDDHRLLELEVATEVNLQDTVVVLHGAAESLRHGPATLESLLHDPSTLEATGLPDPRRFRWSGWTNELTAWFGIGPVALAAETAEPWQGTLAELHACARRLHPGTSGPSAAWTNDPALVGAAFSGSPGAPPAAGPLRWRQPAPTAGGVGWVSATYDNNLLSARVSGTAAEDVAVRLVARTLHRHLVELTQMVPALQFSLEQVGGDHLFAVRAAQPEGTSWTTVRPALLQALEACSDFLDVILAEAIDQARTSASLDLGSRALDAVRGGRRPDRGEPRDALAALTVEQVRAGIDRVRAGSLLGGGAGDAVPDGGRRWRPPVLPPVSRPTLRRLSLVRLPLEARPVRQSLRATATTLEQTVRPPGLRGRSGTPVRTAVDLSVVAARLDTGDTWTVLVDRDGRRLALAWPAYRRIAPLRELVDRATPAPLRTTGGVAATHTTAVWSRLRRRRVGLVLPLLIAVLVVAALVLPGPLRDYQEPVVTTVPVGAEVTLANGSTVQVLDPEWRETKLLPEPVRVVDVRYCGGGVTVDRHTAEDARNHFTWERFGGTGVTPVGRGALPLRAGEAPMTAAVLAEGQCLSGLLGFTDDAGAPAAGRSVTYRNGSGDQITWTLG